MRNLRLITAILILLIPAVMTAQPTDAQKSWRSYSTRFQLDEDPDRDDATLPIMFNYKLIERSLLM
jgi:hypothetical protein